MKVFQLVDERLSDYRLPTLMIAAPSCDWKCAREAGFPASLCQNHDLEGAVPFVVSPQEIFEVYSHNPITQGILFGGLEPFLQFDEMTDVIRYFRTNGCNDPIIIYTGYTEEELANEINCLSQWPNIIVKFGRFVPNQTSHFDPILGVDLISDNQYAKVISKEVL